MATIHSITIKNFKGIGEVTLKFGDKGAPPVNTLIGLNESGKTTILEALSHFVTGDNAVSSLFDGVHSKSEISTLIPVSKKAAFTGKITISADVELHESDYTAVSKIFEEEDLVLNREQFLKHITVTREYNFKDSNFENSVNRWNIQLYVKTRRAKQYSLYARPNDEDEDLWAAAVAIIQATLPRIAYFPTFLVDMPKKIYLSEHADETSVNRYYRNVFQDILDSLDEGLSLQKHVVDRINKFRESNSHPNWLSAFFGGVSRSPIDSVFSKISNAVTKEVLGSWQKIFQRKISARNINVDWNIDTEKSNLPYATMSIFDGESRYYISERSLGFRWFFSFLLFTAFKQKSKRTTLFVFDEPAANLHARAQAELLKSFARAAANGDHIIYSTHSHHMIDPKWISGAYIVENTAIDYDSDEDTFGLNSKSTNIIATPYRDFVAQNPNRTSYFQPVIDMLEYVTPALIGSPPFLLVEGITDYYALKLAVKLSTSAQDFSVMPGVGAGSLGSQINVLLGRGEKFIALLDDDEAGLTAANRYRKNWYLSDTQILTLSQLGTELKGKRLEDLISVDTLNLISKHLKISGRPNKKQIGLYLAEKCATSDDSGALSSDTLKTFEGLIFKMNKLFNS